MPRSATRSHRVVSFLLLVLLLTQTAFVPARVSAQSVEERGGTSPDLVATSIESSNTPAVVAEQTTPDDPIDSNPAPIPERVPI